MCSSSQSCLRIRRGDEGNMKKQSGFRTFSNSAPRLWNALLHIVREYTFSTDTRKLLFSARCWVAALTDNPATLQMFSYFSVSLLGFGLFAAASLTTLLRCEHDSHMNTHALQAHRHHHLPACLCAWQSAYLQGGSPFMAESAPSHQDDCQQHVRQGTCHEWDEQVLMHFWKVNTVQNEILLLQLVKYVLCKVVLCNAMLFDVTTLERLISVLHLWHFGQSGN